MARLALIFGLSFFSCISCFSFRTMSYAEIAQQYESEGEHEKAISFYLKHVDVRLQANIAGENPYFYYLLIGDIYLKADDPLAAKKAYDTARTNKVEASFLVDRAKLLAKYYSEKSSFDQAIAVLNEYRELDTMAIDYEIDFIHKQMLSFEDKKHKN